MEYKKYIVGIVIGICVAVTAFEIYFMVTTYQKVKALEVFATQVTTLINNPK